jgi:hypothetical protein
MEIMFLRLVKPVILNVRYVLGHRYLNVQLVLMMDIIMMDQQHVKHVIQLVPSAQDPRSLNVQNVKLLIS